jgi:glycine/D-amino acid oxidase-like deaminating enzyme
MYLFQRSDWSSDVCSSDLVAFGFSRHGVKFMPVIDEAMADLAVDGSAGLPPGFLGLNRLPH